jgi:hypothetical protein
LFEPAGRVNHNIIISYQLDLLNLSMTVITVTIKKKKALKTLEDLRDNNLIDFTSKKTTVLKKSSKEKTQTHFASEKVLAKTWLTKKEDTAWQSL